MEIASRRLRSIRFFRFLLETLLRVMNLLQIYHYVGYDKISGLRFTFPQTFFSKTRTPIWKYFTEWIGDSLADNALDLGKISDANIGDIGPCEFALRVEVNGRNTCLPTRLQIKQIVPHHDCIAWICLP